MYIDGLILLGIYSIACLSLVLAIYNFYTNKEIEERLNRKPKIKRPIPHQPAKVNKVRSHWG